MNDVKRGEGVKGERVALFLRRIMFKRMGRKGVFLNQFLLKTGPN